MKNLLILNNMLIFRLISKGLSYKHRIILFFTNGLILENDYLSGEVLFDQNIKINNINNNN